MDPMHNFLRPPIESNERTNAGGSDFPRKPCRRHRSFQFQRVDDLRIRVIVEDGREEDLKLGFCDFVSS